MGFQIFISYRRSGSGELGQLLYSRLTNDDYRVFFDVECMRSGKFNTQLLQRIDECTDVLVLLPEGGLDRCVHEDDWVRLEIEYAIEQKKNIIPVMMRNFTWPSVMPESMKELPLYQGVRADMDFFDGWYAKMKALFSCAPGNALQEEAEDVRLYEQIHQRFEGLFGKKTPDSWMENKLRKEKNAADKDEKDSVYDGCVRRAMCLWAKDAAAKNTENEEKYFSLLDSPTHHTVVYKLVDRIFPREQCLVCYAKEIPPCQETETERGMKRRFAIHAPGNEYQNNYLFISLPRDVNGGKPVLNSALVLDDRLFVSKKPSNLNCIRFLSNGKLEDEEERLLDDLLLLGLVRNDEAEPQENERDMVSVCDFDAKYLQYTVIDIETHATVLPEVFMDAKGRRKLRLTLKSNHPYCIINVVMSSQDDFFSAAAEGYLLGSDGLKRDEIKAADAFHRDIELNPHLSRSYFELGAMFRHVEAMQSDKDALYYLNRAAEKGHRGAKCELAMLLMEKEHPLYNPSQAITLLEELLQEGCQSYGKSVSLADLLEKAKK